MWLFVLKFLWLIVPGAVANMAPILAKNHLNFLAKPIDGGRTFKGKPIFGSHKTWRGLITGSIVGLLAGALQGYLYHAYPAIREISIVDFDLIPGWFLGFLMGFGALVGDAVRSFFKRRVGVAPGKPFFPWDQLDSFIGAVIFVLPFVRLPWQILVFGIIGVPLVHIISNFFGYLLGLKKTII